MKNKIILLTIGTILVIVLFAILIFYFEMEKDECTNSPLTYGIKKMSEGNLTVMCTCYFNDIRYSPFYVTEDNVTIGLPY